MLAIISLRFDVPAASGAACVPAILPAPVVPWTSEVFLVVSV